jgi:hypothetical protein
MHFAGVDPKSHSASVIKFRPVMLDPVRLLPLCPFGDLAQMVERSLSMREALGSMPRFSISTTFWEAPRQLGHFAGGSGSLSGAIDAPCGTCRHCVRVVKEVD